MIQFIFLRVLYFSGDPLLDSEIGPLSSKGSQLIYKPKFDKFLLKSEISMMCHYTDNLNKIVCDFLLLRLYWTVTVQVGRSLDLRRVLDISKYTSALYLQYLTLFMLKSCQCVNCPHNPFLDSGEIFTVQVGICGRVTIICLPNCNNVVPLVLLHLVVHILYVW